VTDTLPHAGAVPAGPSTNGHPRHLLLVGSVLTEQVRGAPPPAAVDRPSIPPRVRTVAYFALLLTSWAVLLVSGLAPIWLETTDMQRILATCGVVSSVLGAIAGGLGVAYRPTADPKS
jgi:hypothetical protein